MVTAPIVLLIAVATAPDVGGIVNAAATALSPGAARPAGATTTVRIVPAIPDDGTMDADARAIGDHDR